MARALTLKSYTSLRESAGGKLQSEKGDRGSRVYRGVTIIRAGLGNMKDRNLYPAPVLERAVEDGLFEGLRAYVDHQTSVDAELQPERTIRDIAGVYTNARFVREGKDGGRVDADLTVLRSQHWLADTIDELTAIGHADKIGISINGRGRTTPDKYALQESGETIEVNRLQQFVSLQSADIVTEAGAGGGFRQVLESARGAAVKETSMKRDLQKQLAEALDKGDLDAARKINAQLIEAAGDDQDDAEDVTEADGCGKRATKEAEADEAEDGVEDALAVEDEVDPDEDDLDEANADAGCGCDDKVAEAAPMASQKGAKRDVNTAHKGAMGHAVKPGRAKKTIGQRFGESAVDVDALQAENARLREKLDRCGARNDRLAEALRVRQRADEVRSVLKESGLPDKVRAGLAERLLKLGDRAAMEREVAFTKTLIESAAGQVRDEFNDFDEVEGVGTRLRESFGGHARGDEDGDVDALLDSVGLPRRK